MQFRKALLAVLLLAAAFVLWMVFAAFVSIAVSDWAAVPSARGYVYGALCLAGLLVIIPVFVRLARRYGAYEDRPPA